MKNLVPSLWYVKEAEEAARFYCSIFPNSRIDRVATSAAESPSGPPGSVVMVNFTLNGQPFFAMSAGPLDPFNHAMSITVQCENQEEIDRYWNVLKAGGAAEPCGWVRDKYGVAWQVSSPLLDDMMASPDRDKAKRAMEAMLKMEKLDLAELQRAFDGQTAGARS
jgi:predicted 3-demethylubiquinone-9 3-methyltransferase (glyoxalase superfamily)